MADLTALTLLAAAAALALALVVIPDGCVAALAVVTVRDVTAGPEGFVGTAGLLGAAMDHAGRLAGQVIKGPGHERVRAVRDEASECCLLLLLLVLPRVSSLLGVPVLPPPTDSTLGAAAGLDCSAVGLGVRSANTLACACCAAKAVAVGVELINLMFFAGMEAGRELLSNAGDAASRAGGVLGEPQLLPLPPQLRLLLSPLPLQLRLLFGALRLKDGSCAWAVRSSKAGSATEHAGREVFLAETLTLEVGAALRSCSNCF